MRTEFMGTSYACHLQAVRDRYMGANPEDYPTSGADLLMAGKIKSAMSRLKEKLKDKRERTEIIKTVVSGGMIGKNRQAKKAKFFFHRLPRITGGATIAPMTTTATMIGRAIGRRR